MNSKLLCVIPTFNNESTISHIVTNAKKYCKDVLVINDGCTDNTLSILNNISDISIINHEKNSGKGAALKTGFMYAHSKGFTHILTIDADNQHYPEDIVLLTKHLHKKNELIIGIRDMTNQHHPIPFSSRFGRIFSNAWVFLETGKYLQDTQSGFRIYPIDMDIVNKLKTKRYDFEIEILVNLLWKKYCVKEVTVRVFYPSKKDRTSGFRMFYDNLCLSWLHAKLFITRCILHPFLIKKTGPKKI